MSPIDEARAMNLTEDLKALSAKAADGPWRMHPDGYAQNNGAPVYWQIDADGHAVANNSFCYSPEGENNADFIVALVNAYRNGRLIERPSGEVELRTTAEERAHRHQFRNQNDMHSQKAWDDLEDVLAALATSQAEKEKAERELRGIISRCAEALGNGASVGVECSLAFMAELPTEIAFRVASLRDRAEKAERERDEANRRADAIQATCATIVERIEAVLSMDALEAANRRRCAYPFCDCAIEFPEGYQPSEAAECPECASDPTVGDYRRARSLLSEDKP